MQIQRNNRSPTPQTKVVERLFVKPRRFHRNLTHTTANIDIERGRRGCKDTNRISVSSIYASHQSSK